jgi:2-methylcitrate dehydratase PrpD
MSTVEAIATWAAGLTVGDVPPDILDLCRAQRRSVLGAMAASTRDEAARRVGAAVAAWAPDGPAPLLGTTRSVSVEDAAYQAAVLSIALDFDDYVWFGHTGHSAVLVPMLLAAETGATGAEQLVAQLVASEVEARLGGACLVGPQNGQLWSFIHTAGAALAAGRLLGLDEARLAHALALSLYQPPRATIPGFMAPDSKLLTAAEPMVTGLRAARLAAEGVTGPLDALDHRRGFFEAFADAPLRGLLGGLGHGWAMSTLSVKAYPGCAYVDTMADALSDMGPPSADDVAWVSVEASLPTCQMDALSSEYASGGPTPVTVTFSVPWTAAVLIVGGRLTPEELQQSWLDEHAGELAAVAGTVSLQHDWNLTKPVMEQFGRVVPSGRLLADAGAARLVGALGAQRRHLNAVRGTKGLGGFLPALRSTNRRGRYWDPDELASFRNVFPAKVEVRLRDGRTLEARVDTPRGAAGHPTASPALVAREKLAQWGPWLWGKEGTVAIDEAVERDDDRLWSLLSAADEQASA